MRNNPTPIETLFDKSEDYTKTTLELFKLNIMDKSADILSFLAVQLSIFIVVALFTLIVNIGFALWIGELLGKSYYGYFVMAGFYALIAILVYVFRNQWIKIPISNSIIHQMKKQRII